MNRIRKELIALATGMPEPGLWTGYIVLRTVKDICEAGEKKAEDRASRQASNVIDMRTKHCLAPERVERDSPARVDGRNVQFFSDIVQDSFVLKGMRHAQQLCDQITDAEAKGRSTRLADELFYTFVQSVGLIENLRKKVSQLEADYPHRESDG